MRASADLRAGETGEISEDWQVWGDFESGGRISCAASSFAIGDRLAYECVDSARLPLFGGSENLNIDADALPGRQAIPSLFGDVKAVLTDPASGYHFRR